jgi:nitroreductase
MAKPLLHRRGFIVGAAAAAAAGGGYLYLREADMDAYDAAATALRAPLPADAGRRDLVRYATLAANSHNTQPWRFRLAERRIDVLPDFSRRTPVVDPDDHHVFVSLGCAAENLATAAAARGFGGAVAFDPAGDGAVSVSLDPAAPRETPAFAAIPLRQVSRAVYDGRPVGPADLAALEQAARSDMVEALIVTDRAQMETILALVVEGNTAQFTDPAFMAELKHWIRFNPADALSHGDGLFSATTGNPSIPDWLGRLVFGFVASAKSENARTAEQIRSSAGILVLVGKAADRAHWVECGRAYQRFALEATTLGLRHAFINQAVEVPAVRERLAAELGLPGRRPDLIVRFGTGPEMPRSLRRPVEAVIA